MATIAWLSAPSRFSGRLPASSKLPKGAVFFALFWAGTCRKGAQMGCVLPAPVLREAGICWKAVRNIPAGLAEELPLIDGAKKVSSAVPRTNFAVDNVHSEGDSIKSVSPKSDFPYVDEDIGRFAELPIGLKTV
jgi:hypothetical protein